MALDWRAWGRAGVAPCQVVAEMLDQDQHGIAGHDTLRRSCIFVQEQRKGRRVPVGWGLSWLAINGGYGNPLGEARKEEQGGGGLRPVRRGCACLMYLEPLPASFYVKSAAWQTIE